MDQAAITQTKARRLSKSAGSIYLPRLVIILLIAIAGYFAGELGVRWRHWMWDTTAPIRFVTDIDRGYDWGRSSAKFGYLNQYEKMRAQQPDDPNWLDYAPLRLAVMTVWGKWSLAHFPKVDHWHDDRSYALTAPVLRFNLLMEIIGLVSAFFLTRFWAIRGNRPSSVDPTSLRYFFRGWVPGLVAVLLLWFNPAIVLSAYGWPTWDLWIVPLFLLAALLASFDWWFAAGVVIGIGAMFKGQQLLAAPVFAIWSLMLLRPLKTGRFLSGVVIVIAVVASPWLLTYIPTDKLAQARETQASYGQAYQVPAEVFVLPRTLDIPALLWVLGIVVTSAMLPWVGWLTLNGPATKDGWRKIFTHPAAWRAIAALTAFAWVVWPWLLTRNRSDVIVGLAAGAVLACAVLLIRPGGIACLTAACTGIALLLCMSIFHGSTAWYDCGFHFGTIHWPWMFMGLTDNLPAILSHDFDWPMNQLDYRPFDGIDWSAGTLLLGLFWITFILGSFGLGMQARRTDSRVLIALVVPWLMFFCFPPQIHERYLIFAAAISCICAGVSAGMTLLGVLLSVITFIMTLNVMLSAAAVRGDLRPLGKNLSREFPRLFGENAGQKLLTALNGTHPDLGYAVVLCGLIFLYFSLAPRRSTPSESVA
jgi:hypothetical protein